MTLTGKAKDDFDNWYINQNYIMDLTTDLSPHTPVVGFDELDNPMKYGVFVDWFDSVGIYVDIEYLGGDLFAMLWNTTGHQLPFGRSQLFETRFEARTVAIEKANEIYNKRHE